MNFIPNEKHNLVGGIEATAYLPKPEKFGSYKGTTVNSKLVDKNHGWEAAAFVQEDFQISESISLSAGLRYSIYNHIGLDTVYKYRGNVPQTTNHILTR